MRYSNLFSKIAVGAVAGLMFTATAANATRWNIVEVQSGSDGNFGFSGFHKPNSSNPQSGSSIANIPAGSVSPVGIFDDISGLFNVTLPVGSGGSLFTLTSTGTGTDLNFGSAPGAFGFLSAPATLNINFTSPTGSLQNTILGFDMGAVCCTSQTSTGPNSLLAAAASSGLDAIMTLWGANGFTISEGKLKYDNTPTLGMDLRLGLVDSASSTNPPSVVPLPAALPLYGTGLAIMGFIGWRRKRKAAA